MIDPEFQIAFITSDCNWRKPFCASVLEETDERFGISKPCGPRFIKISFFGDSSNQKPSGYPILGSLTVFD